MILFFKKIKEIGLLMTSTKNWEIEGLQNLLDYFGKFSDFTNKRDLFKNLDGFVQDKLSSSPLVVLSVSLNQSLDDKITYKEQRKLWNKSSVGEAYPVESIQVCLDTITEKTCQDLYFVKEIDGESFICFYFGKSPYQKYFGIFSTKEVIKTSESYFDLLFKFIGNSFDYIEQMNALNKLQGLVNIDDVTGLFNQRKLHIDLEEQIKLFKEEQKIFSVLFIDIDHFKNVNDGHGHLIGSELLLQVSKVLKKVLRESDLIYRYGGDEFVMIAPLAPYKTAKIIGNRILEGIKHHQFRGKGTDETFRISVSIGVAVYPDDAETAYDILEMADRMMYEAKNAGRGRVCMAKDLLEEKSA
jgi:diguanylate cyclase (GGDEF)-like protein